MPNTLPTPLPGLRLLLVQLDYAKRHLTHTITSLRRLAMLTAAVDDLEQVGMFVCCCSSQVWGAAPHHAGGISAACTPAACS